VAAVSDLASAAGDWQSLSSRGHPYKSCYSRVEIGRWAEARVLRSARCRVCAPINMSLNQTSCGLADPWCWGWKPTGGGLGPATQLLNGAFTSTVFTGAQQSHHWKNCTELTRTRQSLVGMLMRTYQHIQIQLQMHTYRHGHSLSTVLIAD